jgi:Fe2+ transport system protein FeoA
MPECQDLSSIPEGSAVEIVRITEEVSDDHKMMKFLQRNGLTPGKRYIVVRVSREADTVTLKGGEPENELTLGMGVASLLFVRPTDHSPLSVSDG